MTDEKAKAQTAQARIELKVMSDIVDALEPFDTDRRTQIFGAVLCIESLEAAKAAIWAWQQTVNAKVAR